MATALVGPLRKREVRVTTRLLVDVGQTGTRLRIDAPSTRWTEERAAGIRADVEPEAHLAGLVDNKLDALSFQVEEIAAGLSGLQGRRADAASLLTHWSAHGVRTVVLADDAVTGYLNGCGPSPGVVLSVGTGVVGLATGRDVARVNGWGHLVGDEGGGYWIGRAGLAAALHAFDGRGPHTELLAAAVAKFGPAGSIGVTLQRDPSRVQAIADFARDVLLAADSDSTAADILVAAARHLARAAHAATTRARLDITRVTVSWNGALLSSSQVLREALRDELGRLGDHYTLTPPIGAGLDGVRLLLALPSGHPLHTLTSRASTRNETTTA